MKPAIYKVTNIGDGSLYVMPKPSRDSLDEDVAYFRQLGINKVLSLLEPAEEVELGLEHEKAICAENAIDFESFSVKDRGLPDRNDLKTMLPHLLEDIKSGKNVSIHCRGGVGRTGIFACCLLIESGLSADESIRLVSEARQRGVPDTQEQHQFVRDY